MTKVLIGEPSEEVRALLVRIVALLGHDPVVADAETPSAPVPDVFIFESVDPEQLELARALRGRSPKLPLIVCSILPPSDDTRALAPAAHVLKPFRRSELAAAVALACR